MVPSSVECSTKNKADIEDGSAAVDLNFTTFATAVRGDSELAWIRLNFTEIYCISEVIRLNKDSSIRHSFVCGIEGCNCTGSNCDNWKLFIEISPEGESTLADLPQCKYGNRVVLRAKWWKISSSNFPELAVFRTVDLGDDGTSLEEVYWSLVGLFSMSSTTLGILLVLKYNPNLPILMVRQFNRYFTPAAEQLLHYIYKCFSSNNTEDEHECDDLEPAPKNEDDALELANYEDCAMIELANYDDAAPESTNDDEHVLEVEPANIGDDVLEPTDNDDDALEPIDNTVSALKPEPIYTIPHHHLIQKVRDVSSSSSSSQSDGP